jgi:hypothetical protein
MRRLRCLVLLLLLLLRCSRPLLQEGPLLPLLRWRLLVCWGLWFWWLLVRGRQARAQDVARGPPSRRCRRENKGE